MLLAPTEILNLESASKPEGNSNFGSVMASISATGSEARPMTTSLSENLRCSALISGMFLRHGTLQGAQKYSKTYLPLRSGFSPIHLVPTSTGPGLPSKDFSETGSIRLSSELGAGLKTFSKFGAAFETNDPW